MLKRNFGESHCEGEPQAKRPNFKSQLVNSFSYSSQNENNVKIPPPNVQNPKKLSVLIELMEKKHIDKSQFFHNVLDYFDEKPGVDSVGSNKQNIGVMKPAIIDLVADDPPRPIEAELPQMLLNPKARLNTPNMLKSPPGQKLRCSSGAKGKQGVQNLIPSNGKSSLSKKKRLKPDNFPSITQMRLPECCIIEKLIERFQNLKVEPLSENELHLFIKNGRPTPPIPSLGVKVNFYDHHLWIAGCPTLGGLYCWICLLFSIRLLKTQNSVWVREGFRGMNSLGTSMTRHINSAAHKEAASIKVSHDDLWITMIQNHAIPNLILEANLGHSSNDTKAGFSLPASKQVSTTTNNQSIDQSKASNSSPPSKPVPSKTNSSSIDVQNKASQFLPATEPVSITSKRFINVQNLPHEDVLKPASFESMKISNTENHVLTSNYSSTGKLNECNTVNPTADKSGENLGPQPQTPQPKINDLMNSDNCEKSSPKTKELPRPKDSSEENLAQYVSQDQYLKLRKELKKKELTLQLSVNNKKQPPGNPSPVHPADTIKLPPSSCVVDLAILQARFFPNGTFNGSETLRELIITTGRPTPEMPGLSQEVEGGMKYFKTSYYDKFPWMCGSAEMNRLFCWPCFVFNDHQHNSFWNTVGYNNMTNLLSLANSHSINQNHLELSIRLKMVESSTKNKYQKIKIDPAKHNEAVRQKRSLIKYLIDAVCFKKKLLNNAEICHEDFNDFLKILSNYDIKLKTILDPESPNYIADFTPNFITNYSQEITKALKMILRLKIAEEVKYSVYVSFILKTVKNKRVALILRYTTGTGEVHERFYKFFKIGFGLQEALLKEIAAEVAELKCSNKFVGISYDGGVLRPDQMESFNSNLRNELIAAHFFHYRDESFQALLQQSLSHTPFCRSFFQLVTELGNFLQANPRVKNFVSRLECKMSRETPKDWDLKSGIIITIRDHYLGIMKFFDQVVNRLLSPHKWPNQVVSQCSKFSLFLGLVETRLFLVLFSKVYVALHPVIEAFRGEFDAKYWKSVTSEACNVIMDIRNCNFHGMCYEAEELVGLGVKGLPYTEQARLSTMFYDVVDWILAFIKYRTKYIYMWSFFDFSAKKVRSPVSKAQFQLGFREYFPFFDSKKLGLAVIFAHNHAQFRNKSAVEIIQVMNEFDFKTVLPELYSYLLLIQTVPQSSANVSRPASDKITSYVEGKTHLKSADALLHLEKDLLSSIRNEETFYSNVLKIISELKSTNEFTEIDQSGKLVEQ